MIRRMFDSNCTGEPCSSQPLQVMATAAARWRRSFAQVSASLGNRSVSWLTCARAFLHLSRRRLGFRRATDEFRLRLSLHYSGGPPRSPRTD